MERLSRLSSLRRLFPLLFLLAPGCIYSHVRFPLDTDVATTRLGSRVGTASSKSVLALVAWGDSGSAAAAKNGGITVLNHMDQETLVILGFVYVRHTTIVYGD